MLRRNLKSELRAKVGDNAKRRESRGRNASELFEFVDEVGLVVITGSDRNIRPIRMQPVGIFCGLSKTQYTRQVLRAQARALEADSAKLAGAQAGGIG